MTGNITQQLKIVNLLNNRIVDANITQSYNQTLVWAVPACSSTKVYTFLLLLFTGIAFSPIRRLVGNPVCLDSEFSDKFFCSLQQANLVPYTTNLTKCGTASCSSDQSLDPATCSCAYPYTGNMTFRAPSFVDPSDSATFQLLETSLWKQLAPRPGAVSLSNVRFSSEDYLQVKVSLFPATGTSFNLSDVISIGSEISSQTYKAPPIFGPYYFMADPYAPFAGINILSM
jgi:hypothetical protein